MGLFGPKTRPPPIEEGAEKFVLWLARDEFGFRNAKLTDAIDQDLKIIGDDSDDFVLAIVGRYGDWVREWPWDRFLCFDEGVPILAPITALWTFLRLPWRETAFPRKGNMERLDLGHIAKELEAGEWSDP